MQLIRRAFRRRGTCRLQPQKPRSRCRCWRRLTCAIAPPPQEPGLQSPAPAQYELDAFTWQAGYETRPSHNEGRRWQIRQVIKMDALPRQAGYETRPYHIEVRSWEILQMIETKKYKYCTLGLFLEEDNKSKPMPPVPWKPRRVPSGVPLDTITL